ncbi:MAG: [Bacteroidales bacterium]|nr:[citrate (pro-3S)-lyase] ligase [Bacteroidales bacterium]
MKTYGRFEISEMPLGSPRFRNKVETFLKTNGLRLDPLDFYLAVTDSDENIVAGAGLRGDVVKCVAVSDSVREEGLSGTLVSEIIAVASARGIPNLKVYTKPENRAVFESMGFRLIARAPLAILMENGNGLASYCAYLGGCRTPGKNGVIVMNANPFTYGHLCLIAEASRQVDRLFVIPVREEGPDFSYEARKAMITSADLPGNVTVLEGSAYTVSAATFPTYFLKNLDDAARTQMRLDLDLFSRHIAPALGASVRFVGSEPEDVLTAEYNRTMETVLPESGIAVSVMDRFCLSGRPVSASTVRSALREGSFRKAAEPVPSSGWMYLAAFLMERSLLAELETPHKPGLVGPGSKGSHPDMDEDLMRKSIRTLRSSFERHFDLSDPVSTGKAVEMDVLSATSGVNTHRGAIFSQILVATAFLQILCGAYPADPQSLHDLPLVKIHQRNIRNFLEDRNLVSTLKERIGALASEVAPSTGSHGGRLVARYGVKGALPMAREGYGPLFEGWLPLYRSLEGDPFRNQKTLLRIMSELDDTCILHRTGPARALEVKAEAEELLRRFDPEELKGMDARYSLEGVSPGGSADMLALTILIDSLTR